MLVIENSAEGLQYMSSRDLVTHYYPLRRVAIRGRATHTLRDPLDQKGFWDSYACEPLD